MNSYEINSISGGMSVRKGHSTFTEKLNTMLSTERGYGVELWTAPADGMEVKKGDQWLHITKVGTRDVDGWVAIVHKGIRYCELKTTIDPDPQPGGDEIAEIVSAVVKYKTVSGQVKTQELFPSD